MRARVLKEHIHSDAVNAKYAVPRHAREGATQTRFKGLAALFSSAPCAVVYGSDIASVLEVVDTSKEVLTGAIVIGGRFGDEIVPPRVWNEAAKYGSPENLQRDLVRVLASPPGFVGALESSTSRLVHSLERAGPSAALVRVLEQHGQNMDSASTAS